MVTYVSMLRGINVGGKRRVQMDALKECYQSLGLADVRTYIQSGNVVFRTDSRNRSMLTGRIEAAIKKTWGFDVKVLVRTSNEMKKVVESSPFRHLDQSKVHVTFLFSRAQPPTKSLESAKSNDEEFSVRGQEVYLYCPNGYGKSKLSNSLFEERLGVFATTRNWNTVTALQSLAST